MRTFESKIDVTDPDVRIVVRHVRESEDEQERYGSISVGSFSIQEAEALIELLTRELCRAKKVVEALKP